jgi:hypothetical protein
MVAAVDREAPVRLLLLVSILGCAAACSPARLKTTDLTEREYRPLSKDAPVEIWVEPPPHRLYDFLAAADNPRVGHGPPGARPLATVDVVWTCDGDEVDGGWVLDRCRYRARRRGGDVLLLTKDRPTYFGPWRSGYRVVVLRSRP